MKRAVYKEIVLLIESQPWDFDNCLKVLGDKYPDIMVETLRSILGQEHKKKVKRSHSYQTSRNKSSEVYERFNSRRFDSSYQPGEGSIVEIARRNRFSPALTAKLIIEEDIYRNTGTTPNKTQVNPLFRDTNLIEDGPMAYEILLASLKDNVYGHVSECIRHSYGQAYERKLKQHLHDLNLPFFDEHQLRLRGYDKTPDIKLEVPISVDGCIINWIESKALFGDDEAHHGYLKDQLYSYWNRFGPGLVICWFGFIDDLDNVRDRGIVVADSFPKESTIKKLDISLSLDSLLKTDSDEETQ